MRHHQLTSNQRLRKRRHITGVLTIALAAIAALSIVPIADGAAGKHRVKLDSTMFAAQIGTTTNGASVFAGAIIDPKLRRGAIVYRTFGTTTLKVDFQEFFTLGSIKGSGSVTLVPGTGGQATLTGSFKITAGTAKYRHARGQFTTTATVNNEGMVMSTLKGSFTD
jgi:hypothetical protein